MNNKAKRPTEAFLRVNRGCAHQLSGSCLLLNINLIPLTKSQYAIVDSEDYKELSEYKWYAMKSDGRFVAARKKLGKTILMHRQIMDCPEGLEIDHQNHRILDNRKANLRVCTGNQNQYNQKIRMGGTSRFKGVSWRKREKKWHAQIMFAKKRIHLGYFDSEIEAAKAYDKKALELFGEYAYLNFR